MSKKTESRLLRGLKADFKMHFICIFLNMQIKYILKCGRGFEADRARAQKTMPVRAGLRWQNLHRSRTMTAV
jgi:hypothetical protein